MLSKNAIHLLKERYVAGPSGAPTETPEGVFERVAYHLGQGDGKFASRLHDAMVSGVFLPNSPCLMNAGANRGGFHACYILPIEDDLTEIFKTVANMAKIFQESGGVGINFSKLRPEGAPLSRGGASSGPLSFMNIFENVVDTVKQGGRRRGALMGILNHDHPDIFNFVKSKLTGRLQNFNLSVMVTNDFMVMEDNNILDLICFASWVNGDPALLFFDRINADNPFYPDIVLDTCNPCSEVSLPYYSACCLGSINLSKFVRHGEFNFERFYDICVLAMRTLSAMNKLSPFPLPEIQESMEKYNPVGVGIMGFADCLIKLGIKYDSQGCLDFIDQVGKVYKEATESYEPDKFYFYRRIIAPTGSLSILADCSSGIEPVYDVAFTRSLTVGKIEEVRDLYKSEYVRTAHQVSPEWHVKVLAQWQRWIDGGASKTVNMPFSSSVSDIKNVYELAWKLGCKGITVYRDGSHSNQPLNGHGGKCSDGQCTL